MDDGPQISKLVFRGGKATIWAHYLSYNLINMDKPDDILKVLTDEMSTLEETDRREQLATYINYLLLNDFNGLIYLLYRVDVDEKKLKSILEEQKGIDSSQIIADLVWIRMKEKAQMRQSFKTDDEITDEEKW
jgi:hypothetical protein